MKIYLNVIESSSLMSNAASRKGDSSSNLSVIWPEPYGSYLIKEGFIKMRQSWVLKYVDIWIKKGTQDTYTIVNMKPVNVTKSIVTLLNTIKSRCLC